MYRFVSVLEKTARSMVHPRLYIWTGAYVLATASVFFVFVILGLVMLLLTGSSAIGPLTQIADWGPRLVQLIPAFLAILAILAGLWLVAQSFLSAFFMTGFRSLVYGGAIDVPGCLARMQKRWTTVLGTSLLNLITWFFIFGLMAIPMILLFAPAFSNGFNLAALGVGLLVGMVLLLVFFGIILLLSPLFQLWVPFAVFEDQSTGATVSRALSLSLKNYLHILASLGLFILAAMVVAMTIGFVGVILSLIPLLGQMLSGLLQIALNLFMTALSMAFIVHLFESVVAPAVAKA